MSHLDNLEADVKGEHGKDKRNTVIAIGTILLVVIAWLTLRSLSSGSTAADGGVDSGLSGDAGSGEGSAADESEQAITNELSAQNGILAANLAAIEKTLHRIRMNQGHHRAKKHKGINPKHPGKMRIIPPQPTPVHPGHKAGQHHVPLSKLKLTQGPILPPVKVKHPAHYSTPTK